MKRKKRFRYRKYRLEPAWPLRLRWKIEEFIYVAQGVRNSPPDQEDPETEQTPLVMAINYGYRVIAAYLLHKGADVNYVFEGETPLQLAARLGNEKMAALLLAHGADPNKKDDPYKYIYLEYNDRNDPQDHWQAWPKTASALHHAVRQHKIGLARRLLRAGADVNCSCGGQTALDIAQGQNDKAGADLLRAYGGLPCPPAGWQIISTPISWLPNMIEPRG